jgi:hypothetical protein
MTENQTTQESGEFNRRHRRCENPIEWALRDFGLLNFVDSGLVLFVWFIVSDCPSNFRDSSIEPGEIASGKSVFANVVYERSQYLVSNCTMTVQQHT